MWRIPKPSFPWVCLDCQVLPLKPSCNMSVFLLTGSRPAHDDGATVRLPREESSQRRWCCPVKCAAQGSWTSSPVTKCRWLFLYSYISDKSYWTYCPRKEPSSDCNKYSILVENEGRAWISKRVLTGKSLRPEPSSPLWGARWINSKFLFNFLRKGRHPKKIVFFLGKSPKLWVGGGQES